jgi:hypothetical protein
VVENLKSANAEAGAGADAVVADAAMAGATVGVIEMTDEIGLASRR